MKKQSLRMMVSLLSAGVIGAVAVPSVASAETTANVSVVSNYIFRGVTQTDGDAAVQGGLDYADESGLYVGGWASTVDFGTADPVTSYEIDLYAGFAGEVEGVGYDVGYLYYAYPDSDTNIDFGEIYGELSYSLFALGVAYTVNSENKDSVFDTGDIYYYASAGVPLANDFSVSLTAGYYDFDVDGDPGFDDVSYAHYAAGIAKDAGEFGEV
ncbi:unnamed protein product, partial [Ectocarpus sp. 12 AP-2014]